MHTKILAFAVLSLSLTACTHSNNDAPTTGIGDQIIVAEGVHGACGLSQQASYTCDVNTNDNGAPSTMQVEVSMKASFNQQFLTYNNTRYTADGNVYAVNGRRGFGEQYSVNCHDSIVELNIAPANTGYGTRVVLQAIDRHNASIQLLKLTAHHRIEGTGQCHNRLGIGSRFHQPSRR